MDKLITAAQAADMIFDNAVLGIGGMGMSGWPEEIVCRLRDRFSATGHPKDLVLHTGCDLGDHKERGLSRLGEAGPGLIRKWYFSHMGSAGTLLPMVRSGQIEAYCIPQGTSVNLWRECAAGRPGLLTKVGLGTFVDPRCGGGSVNGASHDGPCKKVDFHGEEYLFYPSFRTDFALIRGTTADENGNVTFDDESLIHEGYSIAAAAKNTGGKVIVQVKYLAKSGTLDPKKVKIPGVMVDYVVLATDPSACWMEEVTEYDPSLSGAMRKPIMGLKAIPFDERKIICRRAAMELRKGDVINQGVGIPSGLAKIVAEEGLISEITTSAESGAIGGITSFAPSASFNTDAFISHNDMFDFIDGGGLDLTCLGIGQIDRFGNNNVHRFGDKIMGCGGFIDLTYATPRVIFCGTFMAKARFSLGNGEIRIIKEGIARKFVHDVDEITFAAASRKPGQEITYITERCVMQLLDGVLTLTEIAPGIDLKRDILANMDFVPAISPNLKTMSPEIFYEKWGGLEKYIHQTDR